MAVGNAKVWDGSTWVDGLGGVGRATISGTAGSPSLATNGEAYIFTGSGSITVDRAGYLDVLIIGGGGGGASGGGGAGGFWEDTLWFDEGTHTVTVGAGGAASYQDTTGGGNAPRDGFNGASSLVGKYLSPGGGGGVIYRSGATSSNSYQAGAGRTGGSGGGGGITNYSPAADSIGLAIPGFGNNGGRGGFLTGGGGGGAGAVGQNGGVLYPSGSPGGDGSISTIISSADAVSFSVGELVSSDVYYCGGAGGSPYSGAQGVGGLGGGGNSNTSGTANTGGGGGTTGGSGVVIVRVS